MTEREREEVSSELLVRKREKENREKRQRKRNKEISEELLVRKRKQREKTKKEERKEEEQTKVFSDKINCSFAPFLFF